MYIFHFSSIILLIGLLPYIIEAWTTTSSSTAHPCTTTVYVTISGTATISSGTITKTDFQTETVAGRSTVTFTSTVSATSVVTSTSFSTATVLITETSTTTTTVTSPGPPYKRWQTSCETATRTAIADFIVTVPETTITETVVQTITDDLLYSVDTEVTQTVLSTTVTCVTVTVTSVTLSVVTSTETVVGSSAYIPSPPPPETIISPTPIPESSQPVVGNSTISSVTLPAATQSSPPTFTGIGERAKIPDWKDIVIFNVLAIWAMIPL
jgi:hypothetical protein